MKQSTIILVVLLSCLLNQVSSAKNFSMNTYESYRLGSSHKFSKKFHNKQKALCKKRAKEIGNKSPKINFTYDPDSKLYIAECVIQSHYSTSSPKSLAKSLKMVDTKTDGKIKCECPVIKIVKHIREKQDPKNKNKMISRTTEDIEVKYQKLERQFSNLKKQNEQILKAENKMKNRMIDSKKLSDKDIKMRKIESMNLLKMSNKKSITRSKKARNKNIEKKKKDNKKNKDEKNKKKKLVIFKKGKSTDHENSTFEGDIKHTLNKGQKKTTISKTPANKNKKKVSSNYLLIRFKEIN